MADEREHAALGAGDFIQVRGTAYTLHPVSMRQLCEVEKAALKAYKRDVLSTYVDNADLLGARAIELIDRKFEEVSTWNLGDLPKITAHDVRHVPVNEAVRAFVQTTYDLLPESEIGVRHLLSNALDTKRITIAEVERMTGATPRHGQIRYDMWWVNASQEGAALFVYYGLKADYPTLTQKEVETWPPGKIIEAAKTVEALTAVDAKNG